MTSLTSVDVLQPGSSLSWWACSSVWKSRSAGVAVDGQTDGRTDRQADRQTGPDATALGWGSVRGWAATLDLSSAEKARAQA